MSALITRLKSKISSVQALGAKALRSPCSNSVVEKFRDRKAELEVFADSECSFSRPSVRLPGGAKIVNKAALYCSDARRVLREAETWMGSVRKSRQKCAVRTLSSRSVSGLGKSRRRRKRPMTGAGQ